MSLERPRASLRSVGRVNAAFASVLVASGLAAWFWIAFVLRRWNDFQSSAFDLGFFDQIIWNTAHGRPFATTFVPYNFLGQHVQPVLLLFAVPYRFGAGPVLLLATQQLIASAAAVPLFAAARAVGLSRAVSVAVAIAYLANPYLHRAMEFDFHPEVMVGLPAFGAAWLIAIGRTKYGLACAFATVLCKEDAVFVVLALAGWSWWRGERATAGLLASAATLWAIAAVALVMPLARQGASSDLAARYGWLVTSPPSALVSAVAERIPTILAFVGSSALLAVAAPWALLWLVPGLALALASGHPQQATLDLHYAAELVPVAALATIVAARQLETRLSIQVLAVAVLAPVLVGFALFSPASPLAPAHVSPSVTHRAAIEAALEVVPPDGSVSAQSGLVPRLSQREAISEFPGNWATSDWVVLDAAAFRTSQTDAADYDSAADSVQAQLERVFARDGVRVFHRGTP